jgi:L-alanine-DL-glutamate epimerase-like enolase superfamily enzyme
MRITRVEAIPFRIPYLKPLRWGVAGYLDAAEHVLVRIHTDEGLVGTAEAIPRPTIYGESQASIVHALREWFIPMLTGKDPFALEHIWRQMEAIHWNPTAKGAIDLALHDIQAQRAGVPAYLYLGGNSSRVPLSWMLGIHDDIRETVEEARMRHQEGFGSFKVKVGRNPKQDILLVKALREALGDDVMIYVDANMSYTFHEALETIVAMKDWGISLVEEPLKVGQKKARQQLASRISVPILGDESVFTPEEVAQEIALGAIGAISIKTPRTGYSRSRKILNMAEAAGIGCLVGTQAESHLGTLPSAHFAAAFGNIRYPSEISFFLDISDSLLEDPLPLRDGHLELGEQPGFGIRLDPEKLQKYRLDL